MDIQKADYTAPQGEARAPVDALEIEFAPAVEMEDGSVEVTIAEESE